MYDSSYTDIPLQNVNCSVYSKNTKGPSNTRRTPQHQDLRTRTLISKVEAILNKVQWKWTRNFFFEGMDT